MVRIFKKIYISNIYDFVNSYEWTLGPEVQPEEGSEKSNFDLNMRKKKIQIRFFITSE